MTATKNTRSALNDAVLEALQRARTEQRPIGVWQHRDRHSICVRDASYAPTAASSWLLIKVVNPDDASGEIVVER